MSDSLKKTDNKSLSTLVRECHEIQQKLIESGGEMTPELEEFFNEVNMRIPAKLDAYKFIYEEMLSQQELWLERANQFINISKSFSNYATKLKERIKFACVSLGVTALEGNEVIWRLQNSKPAVEVTDTDKIPDEHKKFSFTFEIPYNVDFAGMLIQSLQLTANTNKFNPPHNWITTEIKVNKNSIYDKLKDKLECEGAVLKESSFVRPYANTKK